jgi:hypothetical protein
MPLCNMRRKARETLYGPDPGSAEPVKTAESKTPDTNQRSRLTSAESAEEQARAQAFLDALDAESVAVPARPAPQSVTPKPPIAPPVDPVSIANNAGCHSRSAVVTR